MIRRTPTLIPMSDLDVQDIRHAVAKQREDAERQQKLTHKVKHLAAGPLDESGLQIVESLHEAVAREKNTKQRLGLAPESSAGR